MMAMADDAVSLILYGTDMPEGGCVQVWPVWSHEVPVPGDRIRLTDGEWEIQYRVLQPSEDQIELYADPPAGAEGMS